MASGMKKFYDPDGGPGIPMYPLPAEVKEVAHKLDGQILSLERAVEMIQLAEPQGKVRVYNGSVALEIMYGDNTQSWRVIRYNKAAES